MVATKAAAAGGGGPQNGKRRGGFHGGAPGRQRFKPGPKQMNARNAMFTVNQLDDNPGFLDFNEDVQIPPVAAAAAPQVKAAPAAESTSTEVAATGEGANKGKGGAPGKKGSRFRGNMRRMPPGGPGGAWGPPIPPMPPMFPMGGGGGRRNGGPFGPPPPPHFRVPPMGMRGMRGGPMMPPNGRGFGPGPMPMMPPRPMMPMPPMRGGPMNWGGWNRPDGGPMRCNGKLPPGPGGRPGKVGPKGAALRNGKGPGKPTPGKKGAKSKESVKGPREEYPLDQPWVTDEIRSEHDKKCQLADRLKGVRDDALFAQFKEQRDKFVKMYDAAKLEFIGKHPEQDVDKIMTESESATKPQNSSDAVSTDTSAATTTTTTTTTATPATAAASSPTKAQ